MFGIYWRFSTPAQHLHYQHQLDNCGVSTIDN